MHSIKSFILIYFPFDCVKNQFQVLLSSTSLLIVSLFSVLAIVEWPQDWKKSVFIPIPKKGNAKECSNYCTVALISHDTKEKATAPHSSTLAWKIPWTEEPDGLPSMGSPRVGHDWSDLAAAAAHDTKVMFKVLQARLQQYGNQEFPVLKDWQNSILENFFFNLIVVCVSVYSRIYPSI